MVGLSEIVQVNSIGIALTVTTDGTKIIMAISKLHVSEVRKVTLDKSIRKTIFLYFYKKCGNCNVCYHTSNFEANSKIRTMRCTWNKWQPTLIFSKTMGFVSQHHQHPCTWSFRLLIEVRSQRSQVLIMDIDVLAETLIKIIKEEFSNRTNKFINIKNKSDLKG